MVRTVQLQQTKKHGEVRTTGTAGLRPDWHHGARSFVSRAKRLAVIDGGTISFFVNTLHTHTHFFVRQCTRHNYNYTQTSSYALFSGRQGSRGQTPECGREKGRTFPRIQSPGLLVGE